jgi:hypothetical protein
MLKGCMVCVCGVLLNPGDAVLLGKSMYNHHADAHLLSMG